MASYTRWLTFATDLWQQWGKAQPPRPPKSQTGRGKQSQQQRSTVYTAAGRVARLPQATGSVSPAPRAPSAKSFFRIDTRKPRRGTGFSPICVAAIDFHPLRALRPYRYGPYRYGVSIHKIQLLPYRYGPYRYGVLIHILELLPYRYGQYRYESQCIASPYRYEENFNNHRSATHPYQRISFCWRARRPAGGGGGRADSECKFIIIISFKCMLHLNILPPPPLHPSPPPRAVGDHEHAHPTLNLTNRWSFVDDDVGERSAVKQKSGADQTLSDA